MNGPPEENYTKRMRITSHYYNIKRETKRENMKESRGNTICLKAVLGETDADDLKTIEPIKRRRIISGGTT
jgi:hypothetical protein